MSLFRIVGVIFVLLGTTGVGIMKSRQYYKQLSLLTELSRGMELIRCQMNYTLYSVPKLLTMTGEQIKGTGGDYFIHLAKAIEAGVPRHKAYMDAISKTKDLILPNDALMALMEWSADLGQFDPDGENTIMKLTIERIKNARQVYEEDKKSMVKSYGLLGASAGVALVILIL